ncbi:MAG: AraC family transcriptional regulator [Bacteroidetes bacterium]|jgi:YesN/AraC family two-component response regulator|nr:AraC family transcriptional regulator [Bacteroidota bacterium]
MACESCKDYVTRSVKKLRLSPLSVELGEVIIKEKITAVQKEKLNNLLREVGLEIVENKGGILIQRIKSMVHQYLNSSGRVKVNFSNYLSRQLDLDYNYLSNAFSELEANTITNYMNQVKMEKAKEMILLDDLTMSEIAEKLYYSNSSHFSTQFKKTTGHTPTYFKNLKEKRRYTIQQFSNERVGT